MVAALHGWEGKKYTRSTPAAEGTYEAVVYSNVEDPMPGKKFGSSASVPNDNFQYMLDDKGMLVETTVEPASNLVASPLFDQSSGVKTFKLSDNMIAVKIPGSFHGVSGTYSCTPGTGNICAAQKVSSGFTLGAVAASGNAFTAASGTWTFEPSDANARVTSMTDPEYTSYGWWIHKSANDKDYTASVFVDEKGDVPDITALPPAGTARYNGGAAGKYALYSTTGGTNDAGHFTARATLEADFDDNMIEGTIDGFKGADGQDRNWSVELKESGVADNGNIRGANGDDDAVPMQTVWTIGEVAAGAGGQWSGALQDAGNDGVPNVATGTFTSTYSTSGEMVGAFGVNKQ